MDIVYFGNGDFGIGCLEALSGSGHNLRFVVTQMPHRAGRGRKVRGTAVSRWARANSVAFVETDDVNASENVSKIAEFGPDLSRL